MTWADCAAWAIESSSAAAVLGGGGGAASPPRGGGGGGLLLLSHAVELVAKKENCEGEIPGLVLECIVGLDSVAPIVKISCLRILLLVVLSIRKSRIVCFVCCCVKCRDIDLFWTTPVSISLRLRRPFMICVVRKCKSF